MRRRRCCPCYVRTFAAPFSLDFNADYYFVAVVSCQIPHPTQLLNVLGVIRRPTSPEADNEQFIRTTLLQISRAFVSSLGISMPHTSICRQARVYFPVASRWSSLKLPKRKSYFRPFSRPLGSGKVITHHSMTNPHQVPIGWIRGLWKVLDKANSLF